MPSDFPHLLAALTRFPWAIMPDHLGAIVEVVQRRADGIRLSPEELASFAPDRPIHGMAALYAADTLAALPRAAADGSPSSQGNVIAVISIFGVVAQRISAIDDMCGPGGTSIERASRSFRAALGDPNVSAIVLLHDTPGGSVYGVQAFADEIFKARGQKPIIAQVDSLAASAGYWIASACDEIVITPGGEVGSIGVYALHADVSKAAEMQGVKFTFVSAGKFKVEGNQYEPLGDEAEAAMLELINSYYGDFTTAVARGRGVKTSDVVNGFGEGRVVKDKQAVKMGMADRVATLDDTLRRLQSKKSYPKASAEQVASASPISVTQSPEGLSASDFPSHALMSPELFTDPPVGLSLEEASGVITLAFLNSTATYQIEAVTEPGDWFCSRTSPAEPEAEAEAEAPAEEAETLAPAAAVDAHRRRRHAHRLRNA